MAELETLAGEQEVVRPPEAVKRRTSLKDYETAYRCLGDDGDALWADAADELVWTTPRHTVRELHTRVCRAANLKRLDACKGDRVGTATPLTLSQDPGDVSTLEL